jgi:hypothetical protein
MSGTTELMALRSQMDALVGDGLMPVDPTPTTVGSRRELAAMVPACDAGPAIRTHPTMRRS